MKNFSLDNWSLSDETEGLLFFALIWQEMLFDFSLDSYKNRIKNVPSLCDELISTYNSCNMGLISWPSLYSIRDELIYNLKKDKIAKKLIGNQFDELVKILSIWDCNSSDKKDISYASSIIKKYINNKYFLGLKKSLIKAINSPHEKYILSELCSETLTELIRIGYSRQFIYHKVKSFFFGNRKIESTKRIDEFLDYFDQETKRYLVVFKLPRQCKLISKGANSDFITHVEEPNYRFDNNRNEKKYYKYYNNSDEGIFELGKIDVKDAPSAIKEAQSRLQIASSFVGFFIHELKAPHPLEGLVYLVDKDQKINKPNVISRPIKSTLKRTDQGVHTLEKSLNDILGPFISRDTHEHTKSRLIGALRAHAEGVNSNAVQNQFSNLWTALETLSESSSNSNTLKQIEDNCIPVLCYKYFLKLIVSLDSDLRRCIKKEYSEILLMKNKGENDIKFLTRFLVSEEYDKNRDDIYVSCSKNPLLRFRIFQFHKVLSSAKTARKLLIEHEQRLRWHIKRMYTSRNLLVHGGLQTENLNLLVENLHIYVDHILMEIVNELRKEIDHHNIDKVYYEYKLKYSSYKESLKNIDSTEDATVSANRIIFDLV